MHLIPEPKVMRPTGGAFVVPERMDIVLGAGGKRAGGRTELFAAERFAIEVEPLTGTHWELIANGVEVDTQREVRVKLQGVFENGFGQGYRLKIGREGVEISAASGAGIFYAFQTLTQIVREAAFAAQRGGRVKLPCVEIEDWPDFARRGAYIDCARGKIPTVDTLLQIIDDLGHLKYNEFQIYMENGFEFRRNPALWNDTTPLTAEEILLLDSACRARHIDFVPSLTSLGHFERILIKPEFRHLAEAEPEQLKAIGAPCWVDAPWSLCVTDPEARKLLEDMYAEYVPNFSSGQFNICCDEAYDLGRVRSKELADLIGVPQMYVDWVNYCANLARGHGMTIQMWGDIIKNHPELIGQLPNDVVLIEWGYEADHKFDEHAALFAERVRGPAKDPGTGQQSFYVSPGTSSWLGLAARTKNAFGNIYSACEAGLKHGAKGVLVTDWGDWGHQQMYSTAMTPFAYGAAASWNLGGVKNPAAAGARVAEQRPVLKAISLHLFEDPGGRFAEWAYDLGLTYERFSFQRFNGALEFFLFREKWDFANYVNRAEDRDFPKVIEACKRLRGEFARAELFHPEGEQIKAEFVFTCDLIVHTCERTKLRKLWLAADPAKRNPEHEVLRAKPPKPLPKNFGREMKRLAREAAELQKRYEKLWLGRNKGSRLEDVIVEFKRLREEYRRFA